MSDYIGSTHELKYQFVDRILNYLHEGMSNTIRGNAYHRLVFSSIDAINAVSVVTRNSVHDLISVASQRLVEGDYYNARLFIEQAIVQMQDREV